MLPTNALHLVILAITCSLIMDSSGIKRYCATLVKGGYNDEIVSCYSELGDDTGKPLQTN